MAHGWRKRVAALGAGVVFCTGLAGCMDNDKKPITPPMAKGRGPAPAPGVNPQVLPAGATGTQPGGVQPAGGLRSSGTTPTDFGTPNRYNTGGIGGQTVPGVAGPGAPIPGANNFVPAVGPSGMAPPAGGNPTPPPNYGSSNVPTNPAANFPLEPTGGPVAARGVAPTTTTAYQRPLDPPPPPLTDIQPPPAPSYQTGVAPAAAPQAPGAFPAAPLPLSQPIVPPEAPPFPK
jgi:hypothetical protein